jgi:hypothetical protein
MTSWVNMVIWAAPSSSGCADTTTAKRRSIATATQRFAIFAATVVQMGDTADNDERQQHLKQDELGVKVAIGTKVGGREKRRGVCEAG